MVFAKIKYIVQPIAKLSVYYSAKRWLFRQGQLVNKNAHC